MGGASVHEPKEQIRNLAYQGVKKKSSLCPWSGPEGDFSSPARRDYLLNPGQ
jgi:hypothetical protein